MCDEVQNMRSTLWRSYGFFKTIPCDRFIHILYDHFQFMLQ